MVPEPGVVLGGCPVVEVVMALVVRGSSEVAESVTEVVLVAPSVWVVFGDSSGEEVVVFGKPSVLSEPCAVVPGSSVVFDSVVTGPSLVPDEVVSLLSVVEGVHPANSG